jgi:tetratricopeptide (TPR) repeat protein
VAFESTDRQTRVTTMLGEPVHRTILAFDIEGSTRPERRDSDRLRMRVALYRLLEQALGRAGVQRSDYECLDQGDGVLVLLNSEVPKTRVLPWLVLRLAVSLGRYNRTAAVSSRLRLRTVLHAGQVAHDAHGYTSRDLNLTFGLLDTGLLRSFLANTHASLVLLVSDSVYGDIVEQGYGDIDADAFQPVHVDGKGIDTRAWVYLPGRRNALAASQHAGISQTLAPPSVVVPHELLADIPDFTGREVEGDRLLTALGPTGTTSPPVVVIHGVGGVGKSALAIHAAHRLVSRFPDGQLYVDLQGATAGVRPLDPGEVVGRLLRALGVGGRDIPVKVDEAAARFRSLVAGRRVLLVLDNAVSAIQVRPLLPASPTCAALITCRQRLASLDGAAHLHLDVLPSEQATCLLGRLAGADRLAAELCAAADLARQCGYLPLALRIAGARLAARPSWPVHALVERLADERTRLDELELVDLAVRSSFQLSYQALKGSADDRERMSARLFRLLGLHCGPEIGSWTAAALLGAPVTLAEMALERLVDAQLLATSGPGRYRMHDLLLLFAREQAGEDEAAAERLAALQRMLESYLATTHRANTLLQPAAVGGSGWQVEALTPPLADRAAAFAWFESERANLLAVAQQAADSPDPMPDIVVRLTEVMFWFLVMRTYWRDMEQVNQLAFGVARQRGDRHGEAVALNDLGHAEMGLGHPDRAIGCLEQSSLIFGELGAPLWEHVSLANLGAVYREQGQIERAVDCLERSLTCFRSIGVPISESTALTNLGLAYCEQGRFNDGIDCLEQGLRIRCEIQDLHGEATTISNLGEVHYRAGLPHAAITCYETSLRIYREMAEHRREAETLWRLGCARHELGQQSHARALWQEARAIFEELGVRPPTPEGFEPGSRIPISELC